jgi:hypothetical protein
VASILALEDLAGYVCSLDWEGSSGSSRGDRSWSWSGIGDAPRGRFFTVVPVSSIFISIMSLTPFALLDVPV